MSIIIKGSSSLSSTNSKNIPCGKNTNIIHRNTDSKCYIKWEDPEDIVIDGTTVSSWKSTIIVRKKGSLPENYKDGDVVLTNTVKNKYKNDYFIDSGLMQNTTYYYRFFVMSTNKVYNNSIVAFKIYTSSALSSADPILENNSWEVISKVSEAGMAPYIWMIGDEKKIHMDEGDFYNGNSFTSFNGQDYILQIWDFNHYDKADGSGKAGICFGSRDTTTWGCYFDQTSSYGYISSDVCSITNSFANTNGNGKYLESNTGLLSAIKKVNVNSTTYNNSKFVIETLQLSMFIPSAEEIGCIVSPSSDVIGVGTKFPIFTDAWSRWKYSADTAESDRIKGKHGKNYWLRDQNNVSRAFNIYNYIYGAIIEPGILMNSDVGSGNYILFCFNI